MSDQKGINGKLSDYMSLNQSQKIIDQQSDLFNISLSSITDFAYTFDQDGRFIYSNQALLDLLGIKLKEIVGKNFFDLNYPPELAARLQNQIQHVFQTGESVKDETPFTSPSGKAGFYEYIFNPVKNSVGEVEIVVGLTRNISEHKFAVATALRQAKLIELSYEPIFVWDLESGITEWNAGAERLYGFTPAEAIGQKCQELLKTIYPVPFETVKNIIKSGEVWAGELRQFTKDGRELIVESRHQLIQIDDQELVLETNYDISERKRSEELTATLAAIIESSDDAIVSKTLEGFITSWNIGAEKIFGHTAVEAVGRHISFIIPPEKLDEENEVLSRLRNGEKIDHFETERVTKDGRRIIVSITVSPIIDSNGRIIGASKVGRDVTERRKTDLLLKESEEKFRNLANSISQFAWMTDSSGYIFWYNERWFEYTGTTLEEMQGWGWQKVHHPDEVERVRAKFWQSIQNGETWEDTFPLRSKTGEYRWFLSRAVPIRDENGKILHWFGTNTDIEDVRRAEEKLKLADRRKDEFLATLAHELRNPLAPIRTALEIMKRNDSGEKTLEAQNIIERQLSHITRLVDDLLDVARITQDKIELQIERVELQTALEAAVETARPEIEAGRHEIEIILPDEPIYLDADPVRLSQIFLNLLNNSARYSEPNGKISVIADSGDNRLAVCVKDTGLGISPEKLPHIFGMFTQLERSAKRGQGGLGIGLSLVKSLTELHGGTVEAESEGEGKGCTFIIRLPLAESQAESSDAKTREYEKSEMKNFAGKSSSRRILVVDDNADGAEMMKVFLTIEGHDVKIAFNGKEAVETALEFKPEVCLLDIGLPDIDGYEVARRIRSEIPSALLIALTGWGQDEDRRIAKEAGFDHHLVKPVEIEKVEELIRQSFD